MSAVNYKTKNLLWFLSLIIALFFLLDMHSYLFIRPQGPHLWRQADCLSFALNYANQDNGLFEPELHNLMSDGGETGKSAGEFPILYYTIGKIWKITGQKEWIFRLANLFIFIGGLFALFQILIRYSRSLITSLFFVGMIFTIPVFTFYAPNFLSNITALSLVFMGWHFALLFYEKNNIAHGWLAILFFALAPLLKITALISILALFGVLALSLFFRLQIFNKKFNQRFWILSIAGIIIVLASSFMWYTYSRIYNTTHGGWFTFNDLWPIWQVDKTHLNQTIDFVSHVWIYEYFTPTGYLLLLLSIVMLFKLRKAIPKFALWMLLIMFLGNILYVLLWFKALRDHDYYVINLYALPIFLWGIVLVSLHKRFVKNQITKSLGVFIMATIMLLNIVYAKNHLYWRYNGWMNDFGTNKYESFFDITPVLRNEFNMTRKSRVVAYADPSYCITLYLADQKGWPMKKTDSADFLKSRIQKGAEYILVNDSSFYQIPDINQIPLTKVGQHKNVTIFHVP